jgi:DNA-binding CsgD family transcriptional regulator
MCKKKFWFIFCFFLFPFFYPQQEEIERIDFLLKQSDKYALKDDLKSMRFAKKASLIAERSGNSLKIAETYLYMAKCLDQLDYHKESLAYIDKGLGMKATANNDWLKASFKEIKAANYGVLGFDDQELQEYFEIINLTSKKKDFDSKLLFSRTNARIATFYLYEKKYDKATQFINNAIRIQKTFNHQNWEGLADIYIIKGYVDLENKKEDSAYLYFNKACIILEKENRSKHQLLSVLAEYYSTKKEYKKALDCFKKSLDEMKKFKVVDIYTSSDIYKRISEVYGIIGDKKNEKIYLEEYHKQKEEFDQSKKIDIQAAVNSILNEKNEDLKYTKQQNYRIIFSVIAFALVIFAIFYFFYYKSKEKQVKEKEIHIQEKESEIIEKNKYTIELEQKLQVSLEEVIEEAQKSSPVFFEKFQSLYPDFQHRLLDINSSLTPGELILLAYVYLNFSSKEIADYTFRSFRTVQTRKYTLRKKLGLQTNEDLYIWLKSVC